MSVHSGECREKPVFDLSKITYVGFWKMMWVRLRGVKIQYVHDGIRTTSYHYKGITYLTAMKKVY